ncbi:MAG TPA: Rieske (2Fe-2S) protein [Vicinamibacterales bacterium]|jgi:cytochrome b6-f complex iron-sulfur subunit|nr:Rieske (2Fe-2S) protein [Vicinamibacterales bacterium]
MNQPDETTSARPSRRTFCARAVTLAICGGAMLDACGGSPTSPSNAPALPIVSGTRVSGAITVAIDTSSPLFATGGAALVQTSIGDFLVSRPTQSSFIALTATCTHQACTITGFANQDFVCPCHGSTYDTSGRVLSGPAPAPLQMYPAQFASGILTISA